MRVLITTIVLFFIGITISFAQTPKYVEGTHYVELRNPVPTEDKSKIEVVEIFWYGCPHCYQMQPVLNGWKEDLSDDVNFIRLPAIFSSKTGGAMMLHAKIYYTAKSLGITGRIHRATYEDIHKKKNALQSGKAIEELFVTQGIDVETFYKTYNGYGTRSAVQQASAKVRHYEVTGLPAIIVDGKYKVSVRGTIETHADMLNVVDFLIKKERALSSQ